MNLKKNKKYFLVAAAGLIAWVATKPIRLLSNLTYTFGKLKFSDFTAQNTEITLVMNIDNANNTPVDIKEMSGLLYHGTQLIGQIEPFSFTLPALAKQPVELPFSVQNFTVVGYLTNLILSQQWGQLMNAFNIKWTIKTQWGTFNYNQSIGIEV